MIAVAVTEVTTPGVPPNVTVAPGRKLRPFTVTTSPPFAVPELGEVTPTDGGGGTAYVNAAASVALWPSGFVTTTSTMPAR